MLFFFVFFGVFFCFWFYAVGRRAPGRWRRRRTGRAPAAAARRGQSGATPRRSAGPRQPKLRPPPPKLRPPRRTWSHPPKTRHSIILHHFLFIKKKHFLLAFLIIKNVFSLSFNCSSIFLGIFYDFDCAPISLNGT